MCKKENHSLINELVLEEFMQLIFKKLSSYGSFESCLILYIPLHKCSISELYNLVLNFLLNWSLFHCPFNCKNNVTHTDIEKQHTHLPVLMILWYVQNHKHQIIFSLCIELIRWQCLLASHSMMDIHGW